MFRIISKLRLVGESRLCCLTSYVLTMEDIMAKELIHSSIATPSFRLSDMVVRWTKMAGKMARYTSVKVL